MKTKLPLLLIALFSMTFSFSQGTGEVIITEIYNRPQKPTQQQLDDAITAGGVTSDTSPNEGHTEWFEVYNTTANPVVMDGWTLTDGSSSSNVTTITSYTIQPGEFAIFTGFSIPEGHGLLATDTFGDYIYDYKKPSFNNESSYADAGDTACPDGVTIRKADDTLVDEVKYDYGYGEYIGNAGSSSSCSENTEVFGFPDQGGNSRISMQLDNNFLNATDNDDATYWSFTDNSVDANEYDVSNSQYGTPGEANYADPSLSNSGFTITNFKVFPNPAKDAITINTNNLELTSVKIFDILGKNVLSQNTFTNNTLNVSQLNSGVYFIKINAQGNSITKKVIIE